MSQAHEYVKAHFEQFKGQLFDLLRIPSISTSVEHAGDVERTAQWLADDLQRIGLHTVEIVSTPGHPIVYGEWIGAGLDAKTILIYGHYDVQPALKSDGWINEPFEPTERDGHIYARGSSDDKGQVFAHIKAVEAVLANGGKPSVNLKFLIEGEEEIGSTHLADFVAANRAKLQADVCVISDSGMPTPDQPSIVYALRGILTMDVVVNGPATDLHSGVYGGSVHNPVQALAEIIAQLHNPDGSVAVPGFYDDVLPLSDEERAELQKTAMTEAAWRQATGAPKQWGEPEFAIHERTGARPTLEINGMAGGYYEPGFKTVLPAKAWAKISCRLVANQDPEVIGTLVRNFIMNISPATIHTTVDVALGGPAAFVDIRTPEMQAAVRAYEQGWGKKPVFMREGGSIPVVSEFQKELNAPVILMGLGLNDDGAHSANEHFMVEMFRKGINTAIYFYEAMGAGE
ncbi:MAG: dipeptidase [Anaerolineae bacterium]|nr:dipeptidase [Anaerolineae bacterium]